jgi:glycosyltransferase involved in cell wall biosynthesis
MRILFARPGSFPPELYAGTELTLYWLCRRLLANGHEVVVALQRKKGSQLPPSTDRECGFPVVRTASVIESVRIAVPNFRPDVVVLTETGPWTAAVLPLIGDTPVVVYENEVARCTLDVPQELKSQAVYIANSPATSAHLMKYLGVSAAIVRPLFGVDRYAQIEPRGNRVLFVSLQRRKGSDVAIRIAESRPDASFLFVESWTETPDRTEFLRNYVRKMPNVTLLPNQPSLDSILPQVRLLLMPSRSQEAWGRTATEAQICGIPVLASSRGNLPATVGPGGITLDPDEPLERWLAHFDRIMGDSAFYENLSHKARAHGRSQIEEAERAYAAFEAALREATARRAA